MTEISEAQVMQALSTVQEPELFKDIVTLDMVKELVLSGSSVSMMIELTTPACPLKDVIEREIRAALDGIGVQLTELRWGSKVRRAAAPSLTKLLPNISNVVAVASGKGGVGKSTISVNLAVALAQSGARVGLLDADITGPNLPQMLGATGTPKSSPGGKIEPIERHGVKLISIQFFVPEGQPIVWRGPLIGGAIQQFLRDVEWGELDYLIVDLPPGTSDAQLTLAQAVPLAGAVLVTTPQDVALADVTKALGMFRRMNVPILGIVENMSGFACPHCGDLTEIFGRGGAERLAKQEQLEMLGRIPLEIAVRQGGDAGIPAVAQREVGPAAIALRAVAGAVAARLSVRAASERGTTLTIA